ncbi:MAG TPA: CoA transferase [Candidatus Binataceae bacterium]|nr:CoA transferase [Candidatus Binataceae bacterium]
MAKKAPLEGIRVTDFTWVWAGPYCTLQLAHLGAEVIRIETTTRPCVTRMLPPWPDGVFQGLNRSGYFNQYNQGKKSLTLNFKHPEAKEAARRLIAKSDIVINNFAAGVLERMGFGYEECKKLRPDVIMATLSGYGDSGPYRDYIAYGPAQVPLSGLSSLTRYKDWPPMHAGFSYADPNAGVHAAFALLTALYHRSRTGQGQYIEMSQWECAMDVLAEGLLEYTMNGVEPVADGNRDPQMAPHGNFKCLDWPEPVMGVVIDRWVSIACADDAEWGRLVDAMGQPALVNDPRFATLAARKANEDELEKIIQDWTLPQKVEDVVARLQAANVASAPVADSHSLSEDPNLLARNYFVRKQHAEIGVYPHCGIPWRLSATPTEVRATAPCIGQHTDEVMTGILGYSADEVKKLREKGALD